MNVKSFFIQIVAFGAILALLIWLFMWEQNTGFLEQLLFKLTGWSLSEFMDWILSLSFFS